MVVLYVVFSDALISELAVSFLCVEAAHVQEGTRLSCAAGGNVVVFANLERLWKVLRRDIRFEKVLNISAQELAYLFLRGFVKEMELQQISCLVILKMMRLLASWTKGAFSLHVMAADVQFST